MKQLTVFIENRLGRLEEVTDILSKNNVNIICISLADTSDYGMLRMIVSQPDVAVEALQNNGFSAMLTDVIGLKLPHHFGTLKNVSGILSANGLDIRYMYALTSGENAAIVLKTSDNEKTREVLGEKYEFLRAEEAYNM
ncbi:MAG: hypothetical protein E7509_05265 [Ruminococcus sp.]|nr:hypothetical protein [Ruminococcus sp.]